MKEDIPLACYSEQEALIWVCNHLEGEIISKDRNSIGIHLKINSLKHRKVIECYIMEYEGKYIYSPVV